MAADEDGVGCSVCRDVIATNGTEIADVDGFRQLKVHVDPTTETTGRESAVVVRLQSSPVPIGVIKVIQAGAVSGN